MRHTMELIRFRVTHFRSVEDSSWIEVDKVTALIGTNESGKSNLLLPLWKLNPAHDGEIHPTSDFPRKSFTAIRHEKQKPVFIEAVFSVQDPLLTRLAQQTSYSRSELAEVAVKRRLDGKYEIDFPYVPSARTVPAQEIANALDDAESEIVASKVLVAEKQLVQRVLAAIRTARSALPQDDHYEAAAIRQARETLSRAVTTGAPKTGAIVPLFKQLQGVFDTHLETLSKPLAKDDEDTRKLIVSSLPKFVYYSNYGNLDSEIYLPHVIENLKRDSLGQKEMAKARTLKVLFKFVNLQPSEILELGQALPRDQKPTDKQIEEAAERTKERSILLQSASSRLTDEFRRWWKQGDYRFRFEADGDHFRIWVSDDRRPEEVELEGRSTGLQWFLSFYLVFLVESDDTHSNCILLLDEPGHSLHPLAQRDLSEFFDGLAKHNQLLYTTHSPFLIDADRLDRARKVFIAPDGTSKATPDLGANSSDSTNRGAGYTVHAALGLTVAESLLIGCQPVVVEGPSDQHYLTAIKNVLIHKGLLKPGRELVFPPAGGAKGVKAVASIIFGRDSTLPVVLLDSDEPGSTYANTLVDDLYSADQARVFTVGTYVHLEGAEIEDLIPYDIIVKTIDRLVRGPETAFAEVHNPERAIVPQIEIWASGAGMQLEKGWKVELAKRVKRALLDGAAVSEDTQKTWCRLFADFIKVAQHD